jgi:protein involved in polysaccharide export with SLBB domain
MRRRFHLHLLLVVAATSLPVQTNAQRPDASPSVMTRAELQARASEVERASEVPTTDAAAKESLRAEARAIRERLSQGDFKVGDRVFVRVSGQPTLTDTFDIRSGTELRLPGYDPLIVAGSLRSELESKVSTHVARLLKNPSVTVIPLIRVSVTGAVGRPGFYNLPTDALLSDVIMKAGGPSSNGDLNKVEVRRGNDVFLSSDKSRLAMSVGKSLDDLRFQGGESIVVPPQHRMSWTTVLQAAGTILGAASIVISLSRSR